MKLQRVFALTKKELKKTFRESAVLFMIFLFPVVFVLAFGTALGGFGSTQPVYVIGVINMDYVNISNYTQLFIDTLSSMEILSIRIYADSQIAQNNLSQGKVQAIIVIPNNFSQSLASYHLAPDDPDRWINATVPLHIDKGSVIATQAIPSII